MPALLTNPEKNKTLFLQFDRCTGCQFCIESCPRGVLGVSEQLNIRLAHPPKLLNQNCAFCRTCEYHCPEWALYVVEGVIAK